jgi:hypothetical protein
MGPELRVQSRPTGPPGEDGSIHPYPARALPHSRISLVPTRTRPGDLARHREGHLRSSRTRALDLLNLSDIIPDAVHLTVPRSRRKTPSIPGVKVHTTERPIGPGERAYRDGMTITSATRSILVAAEKGADPEQIQLAVLRSIERGLATEEEMRRAANERSRRIAHLIFGALAKVAA